VDSQSGRLPAETEGSNVTRQVLRYSGVIAAAAAVVVAAGACGSSKSGGSGGGGSGSVTLGFMGAQTGPNAQLGINISDGAQLAVAQHNAKKGVAQVKLKIYDTQGDPTQASSQAKKVVQDKDAGVIGPAFSGESKTALPILEAAKIPNISASATAVALAQNGYKYWHRVLANDNVQGPGAADFLVKTIGAKKIAVIDDQSEYGLGLGQAVRKQIKADGATDVKDDTIDPNGSDYSSTVNTVKAAKPDAVYFGGYYSAAAKLVKQLRDAGVTGTFMSGDGTLDQKFPDGAGPAANGSVLTCTCSSVIGSTDPAVMAFEKAYKAKYKTEPATYSSEGFDAANAFLMAIDAGKKTPDAINSYLSTINFQGVSKKIQFAKSGELQAGAIFVSEVVKGKLKYLGDISTAKPVPSS
jgi:branched-chain amino acid transport system substrate-binding protein